MKMLVSNSVNNSLLLTGFTRATGDPFLPCGVVESLVEFSKGGNLVPTLYLLKPVAKFPLHELY